MWLARDKNNKLYLYPSKPKQSIDHDGTNIWFPLDDWGCLQLDSELFPEVTYESSPVESTLITDIHLTELLDIKYQQGYESAITNDYVDSTRL